MNCWPGWGIRRGSPRRALPHPMLWCEGSWYLGTLCRPRRGCRGAAASLALGAASVCPASWRECRGPWACAVQAPQGWTLDAWSLRSCLRPDFLPSLAWHLFQGLPAAPGFRPASPTPACGSCPARWPPWSSRPHLQPNPYTGHHQGPLVPAGPSPAIGAQQYGV